MQLLKQSDSYGLRVKLVLLLVCALIGGIMQFSLMRFGGGALARHFFEQTDFQQKCDEKRINNLEKFLSANRLCATDRAEITAWVKTQPLILMEIYRSNVLLYSSFAPEELSENDDPSPHYSWITYYDVAFADGNADVVIYADDSYHFFSLLTIASIGTAVLVFLLIFLIGCGSLIRYIRILSTEIQTMESGNLDDPITIRGSHELTALAKSLDSMRTAFKEQKLREAEALQANQNMIVQMSHDLRTPMTVLQIYTDILKYNRCEPGQIHDYLLKIDGKVAQMKQLTENLFEYSLVSREQTIELEEPLPLCDAAHDMLSESVAYLSTMGFRFDLELDWPTEMIRVHSLFLKRVLDNITSNLSKYAAHYAPIQIKAGIRNQRAYLSFQNTINQSARQSEGTHIGVSSMKAMMEKMRGECEIVHDGSTFQTILWFPFAADFPHRNG